RWWPGSLARGARRRYTKREQSSRPEPHNGLSVVASASRARLLGNGLGIRHVGKEVSGDELLNHDVRLFLFDLGQVQLVLPQIRRVAEMLRQKWDQASGERIAIDNRPGQRFVFVF